MSNSRTQANEAGSSSSTRLNILKILADGHFHSGTELGGTLNISRTAIWKQIQSLMKMGLNIYSVKGRGYQLQSPPDLLYGATIGSLLQSDSKKLLDKLDVEFEVSSTNDYLLQRLGQGNAHGHAVLAESQKQGRGRRGTNWVSPPAGGIYLSIAWHYDETPADLGSLSLATGVAVVNALNRCGVTGAGLKWPNDIYWQERKLGGILVESRGENAGPCDVVLGIGLNVSIAEKDQQGIDQDWIDLASIVDELPSRNQLAAELLNVILLLLSDYPIGGFRRSIEQWRELDCACGKKAILTIADQQMMGRVIGIDDQGLLLMSVNGYIKKFMSGQISFKVDN